MRQNSEQGHQILVIVVPQLMKFRPDVRRTHSTEDLNVQRLQRLINSLGLPPEAVDVGNLGSNALLKLVTSFDDSSKPAFKPFTLNFLLIEIFDAPGRSNLGDDPWSTHA